ncbi:MAG: NYN domain-containing protein [Magnetospirillum sp.]|nr:NYN domain-containing protein [Magnetospirillum sp.]
MGHFKVKTRQCSRCGSQWEAHEEKETDVNIALWLVNQAYRDTYDEAFLISRDSDLAPAVRMVREYFPNKRVKMIAPPNLRHSKELANAASPGALASIKLIHLERALFPASVLDPNTGTVIAQRPPEYAP